MWVTFGTALSEYTSKHIFKYMFYFFVIMKNFKYLSDLAPRVGIKTLMMRNALFLKVP